MPRPDSSSRRIRSGVAGTISVARGQLRNRDFKLILIGRTGSMLGSSMLPVALAFGIFAHSRGAIYLGYVLAAQRGSVLLFALTGAAISDRWPYRQVMVTCDVLRCAAQAGFAAFLLGGHPSILALCICGAVDGGTSSIFGSVSQALLTEVVDTSDLQSANLLQRLAGSVAAASGPAISAILVLTCGPSLAIAVNAGTLAAEAFMLLLVRGGRAASRDPGSESSVIDDLCEGWSTFVGLRWYLPLCVSDAGLNICLAGVLTIGPLVAKNDLGGAGAWGAILAVGSLGAAAVGLGLLRHRFVYPLRSAVAFTAMYSALPLGLGLGLPAPVLCILAAITTSAAMMSQTLVISALQSAIPQEAVSRLMSYHLFIAYLPAPFALAVAGPAANALGPRTTLVYLGAGMVLVAFAPALSASLRRFHVDDVAPKTGIATSNVASDQS